MDFGRSVDICIANKSLLKIPQYLCRAFRMDPQIPEHSRTLDWKLQHKIRLMFWEDLPC